MKCCICFSKIESQNAPILTIGKLGNPRCLCPSCERLFDSATLGKTYDEVTEACREIGDTMTRCNADDETVFNEVNSIIAGAMERAESIKDGTYDFSLDEEFIESTNAEQIQEELPEELSINRHIIEIDPSSSFGTGSHATTKLCMEKLEKVVSGGEHVLDMGCGSGILSIAAAKLGFSPVTGFDVDQEAVEASIENAALNDATVTFFRYGLGATVRRALPQADLVAANILGPLLIRFADEIVPCVKRHLIISGILEELYPEVLAAYTARGLVELSRTTIGEWTTGLLVRADAQPA
jgi:ribosomal protein L11 methylase PrmA